MDFFKKLFIRKETHKYAIELLKAAKNLPIDVAEKLPHIKQIRTNYQKRSLKNRTNQLFN
tara:strand:+ start:612 stop:791 length:180 start_codon:yes stop_codon:yes gene_type:complete